MAHENIQFSYNNFALTARTEEFANIDHDNDKFYIKNNIGALQKTYDLSDPVSAIKSFEYVGPRNLSLSFAQLGTFLPFFTFEHSGTTQGIIKRWSLDSVNSELVLEDSLVVPAHTGVMAVEHYETSFKQATTTGTGQIELNDVGRVEIGDMLLLGPSSDVDNQYAFEYVEVTNISGSLVDITVSGAVAPLNEYAQNDKINYWKDIYVFSDDDKLYLVNFNNASYSVIDTNAVYSNIQAASWSNAYDAPGFIKGNNLLYLNVDNFQIIRSQVLSNIEDDEVTLIPIYDLIFDNNSIYRLQKKTTLVADDGTRSTYSWSTYNYQVDQIAPYTKSVSLSALPVGILLNAKSVTIKAIVRDQFGVGLSNVDLTFYDSPDLGYFTPPDGKVITNSDGVASIVYTTNYVNPDGDPPDSSIVIIKAVAAGSSVIANGSEYVWGRIEIFLYNRFRAETYLIQPDTEIIDFTFLKQLEDVNSQVYIRSLSKFQFPGGDWRDGGPPTDYTTVIKQLNQFESSENFEQIDFNFTIDTPINQLPDQENDVQLSQLYISRHHPSGNTDITELNQFRFIEDAVPSFWSEKNPVNSTIWLRMRPYAFDLNQSTLIFKVREVSQFGDTGFIDVTSSCVVSTFDAGGGLQGLDVFYPPPTDFNNNAIIYVSIEVYDTAPTPNIILTNYWFKIIPDYKAPYIDNEFPNREEEDVSINTNIQFDLHDAGEGVDINSLELYVNNRIHTPIITTISGGYRVFYDASEDFNYGQTVTINVNVSDLAENKNILHDLWRFYCKGSEGPWIDPGSFYPKNCSKGIERNFTGISVNVYAVNDTGLDKDSILITIGGKERNVLITPIIYRLD